MATRVEGIRQPLIKYTQLFIYNHWQSSYDLQTSRVINPATGDTIAMVQESRQVDVDRAVSAARHAMKRGSAWRRLDASARGRLLCKLADLIERDKLYLASLETLNCGKPFRDTYNSDVPKAVYYLKHFAGWTDKIMGKTIPIDGDFLCYTRHEPRGVVGIILPWTYPILLCCIKLGCAIAAGNAVLIKPAEQTPLTALYIAQLCKEAGFPPGVVNVVPGFGNAAGHAIATHMDIDMISFTGSTEVGHFIQIAAGGSNLKHLHLELSGKSPNIVFADADLEDAAEKAHIAVFENMGQSCSAGSRTFVHTDIYDEFVKKCVQKAKARRVGDPFNLDIDSGSQIDGNQTKNILELIATGRGQGARLECGGGRALGQQKGFFIEPTVFSGVTDDMHIAKQEICGPVMQLLRFKTLDEVIERANKTQYGLAGAVFTSDINKALSIANHLHAGTIWINAYNEKRPNAPFGGYKMSGSGKEQGILGIEEYCRVKTVMIRIPEKNCT